MSTTTLDTATIEPAIAVHTTADLIELGRSIHDHGFAANEHRVAEIVTSGRRVAPDLVSLEVLADRFHPDIVRARALARLTADWEPIEDELRRRRDAFETAMFELFEGWSEYHELQASGSSFGRLVDSRSRLDGLRLALAHQRHRTASPAA